MRWGLLLGCLFCLLSASSLAGEVARARLAMGTLLEIRAHAPKGALDAAFGEVARLEKLWSHYRPQSELSQLNKRRILKVSGETTKLLQAALQIAEQSHGAFNPALGALSRARREGKTPQGPPPNWRGVQIQGNQVALPDGDSALDLGGIGKGAALDAALEVLVAQGAKHVHLSFGGSSHLFSDPQVCRRLRLGGPKGQQTDRSVVFAAAALATSSNQGSLKMRGETAEGHLIDPWRGRPMIQGEAPWSATVLGPTGQVTDAWATAMAVLGPQRGVAIAQQQRLSVVWLGSRGEVLGLVGPWQVGSKALSLAPCSSNL